MTQQPRFRFLRLLALALFLCAGLVQAAGELRVYIWSEYIDPKIVQDFEKKFGCKVILDLYESNEEMMAKLQAGGVSQYDIVIPSDFVLPSMIKLRLLKPLDKAAIPNMKNLKEKFQNPPYDPGNKYSAGWQWGTVGLMYNKAMLPDFKPSWAMIFQSEGKKRPFVLIDSEREMIGIALKYLGFSMNTLDKPQLKATADLLIKAKKNANFLGFEGGVGGKNKVAGGTASMALVYSGDAIRAMGEDPKLGFVNPSEGTVVWVDNMAVPAKAPHSDLAMKFINFILEPKVGAQLSNFNQYATPNAAAMPFITKEDLANPAIYPDETTMKRLEFIKDLGKDNRLFSELWKIVKTR
ncbi:MAG TPA: spermidine/putrescine ABC transporter substrate-binding protein [Fibrobacteraceae bacterium]|nr:spermidine/putrescine ABC transporter substrate-binding protein [Fibrobacteraceae bacterium]